MPRGHRIVHRDEHLRRVFILESETDIGLHPVPNSKCLRDCHARRRNDHGQIVAARANPAPGGGRYRAAGVRCAWRGNYIVAQDVCRDTSLALVA